MFVSEKIVIEASILKLFLTLMPMFRDNSVSKVHVYYMERKCAKEFSTFLTFLLRLAFLFPTSVVPSKKV